jgi:hypothetical protein
VDVHKTGPEQIAIGTQCLACFHHVAPAQAWYRFVAAMLRHLQVSVPAIAKPAFVPHK